MTYMELRGSQMDRIPQGPGLYAWYYRPSSITKQSILSSLVRLLSTTANIKTEVTHRYGMRLRTQAVAEVSVGSDHRSIPQAIEKAFEEAGDFLSYFYRSEQFAHFCRPIYIGIAKDLFDRVYRQHYSDLIDLWAPESRVSKFLNAVPDASVQAVMDRLDLPHSFALEARVCGIAPQELMVSVHPTNQIPASIGDDGDNAPENETRKALERMLHLLSDPVLGRR